MKLQLQFNTDTNKFEALNLNEHQDLLFHDNNGFETRLRLAMLIAMSGERVDILEATTEFANWVLKRDERIANNQLNNPMLTDKDNYKDEIRIAVVGVKKVSS